MVTVDEFNNNGAQAHGASDVGIPAKTHIIDGPKGPYLQRSCTNGIRARVQTAQLLTKGPAARPVAYALCKKMEKLEVVCLPTQLYSCRWHPLVLGHAKDSKMGCRGLNAVPPVTHSKALANSSSYRHCPGRDPVISNLDWIAHVDEARSCQPEQACYLCAAAAIAANRRKRRHQVMLAAVKVLVIYKIIPGDLTAAVSKRLGCRAFREDNFMGVEFDAEILDGFGHLCIVIEGDRTPIDKMFHGDKNPVDQEAVFLR
jgi:hypothetical protein